MDERILLFGGKSQAIIAYEMLREQGRDVAFVFDPFLKRPYFAFDGAFGNDKLALAKFLGEATDFVVCIGAEHGLARVKISEMLAETHGLRPIDLISPNAIVDPTATYGAGVQIMPGSVLHKHARVGTYTILNTNCTVDHECVLGSGVHIMGAAAIAGRVEIDNYVAVGTNATILPDLKIGEGAFVAAGAVVLRDVEPFTVVAGNPARKLRKHEPVCEMLIFEGI
jgi:sugar O-acyltransferase (sialic acid O-acetyltransferase NeuD family)